MKTTLRHRRSLLPITFLLLLAFAVAAPAWATGPEPRCEDLSTELRSRQTPLAVAIVLSPQSSGRLQLTGLALRAESGEGRPGCLVKTGESSLRIWTTDWESLAGGHEGSHDKLTVGAGARLSPALAKELDLAAGVSAVEEGDARWRPAPKGGVVFEIEVK